MNSFLELPIDQRIVQAITQCGYTKPTDIQARAIPTILDGKDVIGATETGSGKTAAFVIPTLHHLANSKRQGKARALILTPTRELAMQIVASINKYGSALKLSTATIIGGASYRDQDRMLARPDIVVATPGRLIDRLENGRIDLSGVEIFVLDEADRMLEMGFVDDVKHIANSLIKREQTLLFTATLDHKLIKSIGHLLDEPIIIDISKPKMVPKQIEQKLFVANNQQQKLNFLENLLTTEKIFKGIIFAGTKIGADQIAYNLRNKGHKALALHGDLKQHIRKKSMHRFTTGEVQFLVATDIASRGIDVKDVSHVINFDLPKCAEDYVHRAGRTGRAGKPGIAITIALKDEKRYVFSIERHIGMEMQFVNFDLQPEARPEEERRPSRHKKSFQPRHSRPKKPQGGYFNNRGREQRPTGENRQKKHFNR